LSGSRKEYTKAFEYLYKAIELATEIEQMAVVADYYNNLGNIYKDQALHKQATDIYFEALAIWESLSDTAGMSIAFGSIGNMYYLQGNYGKALEYFQKKIPPWHCILTIPGKQVKRTTAWQKFTMCSRSMIPH
jgi:tetratricopeptide (TPR) repeat protein